MAGFYEAKRLVTLKEDHRLPSKSYDCIPKLVSYIVQLTRLQRKCTYAMDETVCWHTTVASTTSKEVPVKTTGHKKDHFTVLLKSHADGKKMKPYIVFLNQRGTHLIKELQKIPGVVIVSFSSNGWMNDSLTADYLQKIIGLLSFSKCLLIWDVYKCHTSQTTRVGTRLFETSHSDHSRRMHRIHSGS